MRVLLADWVEPEGDGQAAVCNESRISPVDRGAAFRLRALWTIVGGLERLVGGEALERGDAPGGGAVVGGLMGQKPVPEASSCRN